MCFKMPYNNSRVLGFPGGSEGKMSVCNADPDSIPGLRRSPEEGNGNPFQYPCLENPPDRGVHRVAKSQTQQGNFPFILVEYYHMFKNL